MSQNNEEFEVLELIKILYKRKLFIFLLTTTFAISAVLYSLSLPNTFKSDAILASASGQTSSGANSFGGLANLAGVSLGGGDANEYEIGIEILTSRDFTFSFIKKNKLGPIIYAVQAWDEDNNKLIFDETIFNSDKLEWISYSNELEYEIFKKFKKNFSASFDKNSGLLAISYIHSSPHTAKNILDLMIKQINNDIRVEKKEEALRSIDYINAELKNVKNMDVRALFNSLLYDEYKTITKTNIKPEYFVKVIDAPYVPFERHSPKRAQICIYWTFIGFFMSVVLAYFFHFLKAFIRYLKN
jgi:LPS O-antigen subunit length determinant protein (WzzB/FepE family)